MHKYATNRWIKAHPNNLATHGATEPIMTVLDVRGFPIHDLFLIGLNEDCGSLILPTQARALAAQAALEPAYKVAVKRLGNGDWTADYTRRALDGTEPGRFVTDVVLKDGTVAMRNGRWTR